MKKILALTLSSMIVLGGSGIAVAAYADSESSPATEVQAENKAAEQNNLYLVPGTYVADGDTVENVISAGAEKLTDEQCGKIFTPNAYLCTLTKGAKLPVPTSEKVDKDGTPYAFNGWWTIVDATVTYFETVPEITETTFLYADWRADLSQRKDPIVPDESTAVQPLHYMSIKRKETGATEIVSLRVSGTDMMNAETLGYGAPVQLYNGWFDLNPGDVITVYTAGFDGATEAQVAPLAQSGREISLESSGDLSNVTADYLEVNKSLKLTNNLTVTYKESLTARPFRIYIKFYFGGLTMAIYMEPMD